MIDFTPISSKLTKSPDGIWYSSESENTFYPTDGSETCFSIEENSFWFQHRNQCITTVVNAFPPEKGGTIFDIGGGNGFTSLGLAKAGFNVTLIEPSKTGAENAKLRGVENIICATTTTAGIYPDSFPAAGLFDVIEHIEDDIYFLSSIHSLIEPGGRLYITVPLYQALWSGEDKLAGHFRRYTPDTAKKTLKAAGFEIEYSSCFFRALPLPIYLLRALPFKLGITEQPTKTNLKAHKQKNRLIHNMIRAILRPELKHLNNKQSMRFGASLILVARKSN